MPLPRKTPRNKTHITITEMIPVGNYAVRLILAMAMIQVFSAGHSCMIMARMPKN